MEGNNRHSVVGWIALVIAVMALVTSLTAYNRSGRDLEQQINDQTVNVRQEVRQQVAITEARARLLILRSRIATGLSTQQAAAEIEDIRASLEDNFEGATTEAQAQWRKIDADLNQLGTKFRNNSADALNSLERSIDQIEDTVRTDNTRNQ